MRTNLCVCPVCMGALHLSEQCYHCTVCGQDDPVVERIPDFFIAIGNEEENPA